MPYTTALYRGSCAHPNCAELGASYQLASIIFDICCISILINI